MGAGDPLRAGSRDGIKFDTLSTWYATPPAFPNGFNSTISGLDIAANGDVWVSISDNGVWRLGPDTYDHFTELDGLGDRRSRNVNALLIDDAGIVWAGMASTGLSRYDGTEWTTLNIQDGLSAESIGDLAQGTSGELWIALVDAINGGLTHYDGVTFTNYQRPSAPSFESIFVSLAVQPDGTVWAGSGATSGITVFQSDGTWVRNFETSDGLRSGSVPAMSVGPFGEIWIAPNNQGVQRWNGSVWEDFDPSNSGIADAFVSDLLVDDSGAMWFGTLLGASRFEGARWLGFDDGGALPTNEVTGLSRVPSSPPSPDGVGVTRGPLYVSVNRADNVPPGPRLGGALLWDELAFVEVESSPGNPLDRTLLSISSTMGGAWSVDADSLYEISDISLARSIVKPNFLAPGENLSSVLAHSSGDAWVGTQSPGGPANSLVLRFDGTSWDFNTIPELSDIGDGVFVHDEDASGWVWASFTPGTNAARFNPVDRTVELYGIAEGLPAGSVTDIHVASDGNVWFATSAGVAKYDGAMIQALPTRGLRSTIITSIGVDQVGRVWVGTAAGVAYFQDNQWSSYGPVDGLPGDSITEVLADTSETIFGTEFDGLALFHRDSAPPRAQIVLGPPQVTGQRGVAFAYTGGDLNSLNGFIELASALDGGMRSPFSGNNTEQFFDLADGVHVLEVWARDRGLNESASPSQYVFEVDATPPQPQISNPLFGRPVEDLVPILGDVFDDRFGAYGVAVRPVNTTDWDTLIVSNTLPVDDVLVVWDTNGEPDGPYEISVSVQDTLGLRGFSLIPVIVDNEDPKNEVTSPARVVSQEGGRIFTLNAEVEVYFPPNALTEDRIITIQPAAIPSDLPPGASRALGAWRITPDNFVTEKPVTLTFSLAGLDSAGQANGGPALQLSAIEAAAQSSNAQIGAFVLRPDSTQQFLGGSLDVLGGTLTSSNAQLGTYVVYEGLFQTFEAGGAKNIDIQPRAFSPRGTTFDDRAAISFNVGSSGNVRVYAYNRSGRIVRRVFEGSLPPGRNVIYWDGLDARGAVVPSGLYLIAVDAEGETDVKSVAVVNR